MPIAALIPLILQGIQAAIAAAPGVVDIVNKAKEFISSLTSAKLITVEQQAAIHGHIDSIAAMVNAGFVPLAWQVQPD